MAWTSLSGKSPPIIWIEREKISLTDHTDPLLVMEMSPDSTLTTAGSWQLLKIMAFTSIHCLQES